MADLVFQFGGRPDRRRPRHARSRRDFPIESTVDTFTPNREIGWSVHKIGFEVHHAWVLVPEKGGVRVITEETQKGADAIAFRQAQPKAMYDGHDWWLSALKARAERMAHSPAPAT